MPGQPEDERRTENECEPTGNVADDFLVDGREVGVPHIPESYDPEMDLPDSEELDAEIQGGAGE